MNVADKNNVDKSIHVLISQILGIESNFDVVPNVTTFLVQTGYSIETPSEKFDGKFDSEYVPVKSPKNSKEKMMLISCLLIYMTNKRMLV